MRREAIKDHKDLEVYKMAFDAAMNILEVSKKFPVEERYSLTDQIVGLHVLFVLIWLRLGGNGAMYAKRSRRVAAFIAKLNDCEAESAETQTWIEFAVKCNYMDVEAGRELYGTYNQVLSGLVNMINNPSPWLIKH